MKSFRKIFVAAVAFIAAVFLGANLLLLSLPQNSGSPYRVEIDRLAREMEEHGTQKPSLSGCQYVKNVVRCEEQMDAAFFAEADGDYAVRVVNNVLYRFDYVYRPGQQRQKMFLYVNLILAVASASVLFLLFFLWLKILKPFEELRDVPYELSRGNLSLPLKEQRYHFFGKFVWGLNVLREDLEQHRERELCLQKEKKTLVLSLSHDIKTPLSAIKLYAKALSKGLYNGRQKQLEIAQNIGAKADEIENFLAQIIEASSGDFLDLEVRQGEFYLSELAGRVADYYSEKLAILKIGFTVGEYVDCVLQGDFDRSVEVLQNIIENAAKYGDGHEIALMFSEEEDCQLVTVRNTGCTLPETELTHIFESFARGTNADNVNGSGLGLYICRQLMHKMQGEVFAEIKEGQMFVTVIFVRA